MLSTFGEEHTSYTTSKNWIATAKGSFPDQSLVSKTLNPFFVLYLTLLFDLFPSFCTLIDLIPRYLAIDYAYICVCLPCSSYFKYFCGF